MNNLCPITQLQFKHRLPFKHHHLFSYNIIVQFFKLDMFTNQNKMYLLPLSYKKTLI